MIYYAREIVPAMEVEDIVADGFCFLLNKLNTFNDEEHAKALLFNFIRSRCIDFMKIQKSRRLKMSGIFIETEDDWAIRERAEIESHLIFSIKNRLEQLQPQFKRVIELAFFKHHTNEEICQILGIQDRTVRNLKSDALRALKLLFFDK